MRCCVTVADIRANCYNVCVLVYADKSNLVIVFAIVPQCSFLYSEIRLCLSYKRQCIDRVKLHSLVRLDLGDCCNRESSFNYGKK